MKVLNSQIDLVKPLKRNIRMRDRVSSAYSVRNSGFSLIELIITIVVTGVLSGVLLISVSAKAQHSVTAQADEFRRALSHLQLLAISQGARLKLTVTAASYSVCAAATANCISASAITDPATGRPFSIALSDGATFTSGVGDYYFDSLGRPVAAAIGATLAGVYANPLTLKGSGNCVNVTILPITGFASSGSPYAC